MTQNTTVWPIPKPEGLFKVYAWKHMVNAWKLGFFVLNKLFSLNKIEAGGNLGICVSKLPSLNVFLHMLVSVRYVRQTNAFSLLWSCQQEKGCQRKSFFCCSPVRNCQISMMRTTYTWIQEYALCSTFMVQNIIESSLLTAQNPSLGINRKEVTK